MSKFKSHLFSKRVKYTLSSAHILKYICFKKILNIDRIEHKEIPIVNTEYTLVHFINYYLTPNISACELYISIRIGFVLSQVILLFLSLFVVGAITRSANDTVTTMSESSLEKIFIRFLF